jgi:hypothetical protein
MSSGLCSGNCMPRAYQKSIEPIYLHQIQAVRYHGETCFFQKQFQEAFCTLNHLIFMKHYKHYHLPLRIDLFAGIKDKENRYKN